MSMTLRRRLLASFACSGLLLLWAATAQAGGAGPGITPDQAIARLKEGNTRFVSDASVHPNTNSARLQQAATENQGDHAIATVITCSDSRVPVERLFDAGVMDIFVIRVAGNVCDTDEVGSIEYGLAHVNTPVLVVLGHTQCGAVTAVTHAVQGRGHALERNIPPLVDNIQPAVQLTMKAYPNLSGDAVIPPAIEENVWQGIDDLFMSSPSTRQLVKAGKVKVVGAIYDVGTGRVKWLSESKTGAILASVEATPARAMNAMAGAGHDAENPQASARAASHGPTTPGHAEEPRASARAASPSDGASAHGGGHAQASGSAGVAHSAKAVKAESVTLIDPSKLSQLDQARHRKVDVAAVTMAEADHGISFLWKIGIALMVVGCFGGLLFKSGAAGRLGVAGKLYTGFGAVVALALIIGGLGYNSLERVNEEAELALATMELDMMAGEIEALQSAFLLIGIEDKQQGEEILKEHKALMEEYQEDFTAIRGHDLDKEMSAAVDDMEQDTAKYKVTFADLVERFHEIEEDKEKLYELGEKMDEQLAEVLHQHQKDLAELESAGASMAAVAIQTELVNKLAECEMLALKVAHNEIGFLLDKNIERVQEMERDLGVLLGTLKVVEELVPLAAKDKSEESSDLASLAKVEQELDEYQELLTEVIEDELVLAADRIDCTEQVKGVMVIAAAFSERSARQAESAKVEAEEAAIALMVIAAIIGSLFAFFITRGITKPINRIVTGLNEGADQVNDAAAQVSSASQQLAEGASEQASSLEETSSALEEMAAMTRTNAENAKQANSLSDQARTAAETGDQTMGLLNQAMTGINESSGKISKIIKVIEEIAFQTNLLALNAAVEAARAGEHGKGFAVVADEVRNLAMRAAEAARETTGLIEDSTNKAKEGTEVAEDVGKALGGIVGDVSKVSDLINGISKASDEQAQGVDQVNTAVSQMDKVTQQNAAGAEESASAAEELSAQAQAVQGMVNELAAVISGSSNDQGTSAPINPRQHLTHKKKRANVNVAHLDTNPRPEPVGVTRGKKATMSDASAVPDGTGLPDDDDAMKDF